MGCAASSCAENQLKETGLRLLTSKLHFKPQQLEKLNDYFRELANSESTDIARIETTVERLVQRLIAGVGNLDRRFSALFLVSLNERRRIKQLRFEYLLRLDALSTPSGNPDVELALSLEEDSGLPGFARLKVRAGNAGSWAEFIGPDGRLRRDLVKVRVAALLAAALKKDAIANVDEKFCITPGQVVDAEVLDKILKQPEHCRVFYGPAEAESQLPDIGDHRVVIVEDESGVILKIGLHGSKSQDIEVKLLIGASSNSWPICADYPKRIPLHHCDALLHYTAAQSGMFVVAAGPHQGIRCDDRASLWRVRVLAAEVIMRQHYCDRSVPALTESALLQVLDQLRGRQVVDFPIKRKGTLKLVSRYIIRAIHWWSLERSGPDPVRSWTSTTLSHHVLMGLDELLRALRCQNLRCYFQPRCNLMLQCARGGNLHHEDAYAADASLLESYLEALQEHSLEWVQSQPTRDEPKLSSDELLEKELVSLWRQVVASLPRGTMSGHYGYGPRQLQYLGLVAKEVLAARNSLHQGSFDNCSIFFNLSTNLQAGESIDNLIYLLSLVLKQAKEQVYALPIGRRKKRNRRKARAERKRSCAKAYFDRSVDFLIDIVRKDRETAYLDLDNHTVMAKTLLKWLYFGMEEDKKVLGPLLRPYLGNLFNSSHEYAWHVESWRKRQDIYSTEMRSLGLFCKLVTAREILPANGIVESLSKGWAWAENIARMIEHSDNGLKLIFITTERILRYQLKFADDKGPASFSTWSKARSIGNAVRRASIARTSLITANDTLAGLLWKKRDEDTNMGVAGHVELREASPLTLVAVTGRRRGRQRGPGDLIPALVTLNKFRILQQVAQVLPQQERTAMLELIQRASRQAARRLKRASYPDSTLTGPHRQLYTPRSESRLHEVVAEYSPKKQQQQIILERQLKLRHEILEIHDTLTRGLRSRDQLPSWDSTSMTSSWGSLVGSIGRGRLKRHNTPIWDSMPGTSPLWDSVSCNSTYTNGKSDETTKNNTPIISRTEFKTNNINDKREEDFQNHKLNSWELLEKTLSKKFVTSSPEKLRPFEENKDVSIEYLVINNDTKEI